MIPRKIGLISFIATNIKPSWQPNPNSPTFSPLAQARASAMLCQLLMIFSAGIVYIGALRNHPEEVAAILGLPPQTFAVFGLCMGYPDPQVPTVVKPRLSQSAILHYEQYQLAQQDEAIDTYDKVMNEFYTTHQLSNPGSWSEHSSKRITTRESLSGRDRLTEILRRLGFPLK